MAKKKQLPKTIFVMREEDRGDEWLRASENAQDFVMIGETVGIGEYRLVKTHKIKGAVEFVE